MLHAHVFCEPFLNDLTGALALLHDVLGGSSLFGLRQSTGCQRQLNWGIHFEGRRFEHEGKGLDPFARCRLSFYQKIDKMIGKRLWAQQANALAAIA